MEQWKLKSIYSNNIYVKIDNLNIYIKSVSNNIIIDSNIQNTLLMIFNALEYCVNMFCNLEEYKINLYFHDEDNNNLIKINLSRFFKEKDIDIGIIIMYHSINMREKIISNLGNFSLYDISHAGNLNIYRYLGMGKIDKLEGAYINTFADIDKLYNDIFINKLVNKHTNIFINLNMFNDKLKLITLLLSMTRKRKYINTFLPSELYEFIYFEFLKNIPYN